MIVIYRWYIRTRFVYPPKFRFIYELCSSMNKLGETVALSKSNPLEEL